MRPATTRVMMLASDPANKSKPASASEREASTAAEIRNVLRDTAAQVASAAAAASAASCGVDIGATVRIEFSSLVRSIG